jgi:two-component system phosphate regulon sensor histidine kinase PhoR
MEKKITLNTMLLSTGAVLLTAVILCTLFYEQLADGIRKNVQDRAKIFVGRTIEYTTTAWSRFQNLTIRITIIDDEMNLVFDNEIENSEELHLPHDMPEKIPESTEYEQISWEYTQSGNVMYCYGVQLSDGWLFVSQPQISGFRMLARNIWALVLVILLVMLVNITMSRQLARQVVSPLGKLEAVIETDGAEKNAELPTIPPEIPYDELAPVAKLLKQQNTALVAGNLALRERDWTISALLNNVNEGVVLLDIKGYILSVNKSASKILNVQGELEGKSILELYREMDFFECIERALKGERDEISLTLGKKEYRVLISPVADNLGACIFFFDVTGKMQAEKMRQEFAANVSHELKTPITSIYGTAEMLSSGIIKPDDTEEFYNKIMREASRLITLIEDILFLSELDENALNKTAEGINAGKIALECAEALSAKAEKNEVTVNVSGDGHIFAVRSHFYELVYNLIDNAIKYNKQGGTVDVNIEQNDSDLILTVKDTGIGISEAEQSRIFERFYRVDKSRSKKSGGTGLGLAIVKHAAITMGGNVTVESKQGEGSTFTFIKKTA